jgi:basic amino acid/polyamine antiporter, APA family
VKRGVLGVWSGIGLVSGNMIGAGVFLSAGFMAQVMEPTTILASWLLGLGLALCGARAYAEVAARVPRSGGEYRYLSELLHPALGYLAGWASLLVGFAAPVAVNALGAAGFLATVAPLPDHRWVATGIIVWLTATHAAGMRASRWTQNLLAWLKVALVVGFVALGLALGERSLPGWSPPAAAGGLTAAVFAESQFFIVFAFSGWNAAIYVAEEFARPRRDVQRSMLLGCLGVGVLYLLVNFVLVANVTPEAARSALGDRATTVGHVVASSLVGEVGGTIMSIVVAIVLVSAASAMTFIGPRVAAAMAVDGYLPRALAGAEGRPPAGSVVLQGAIALVIVWAHGLQGALGTVGAVLMLFAALVCLALFKVALWPGGGPRPAPVALAAAVVYVAVAGFMLYVGFRAQPSLLLWCAAVAAGGTASYLLTRRVSPNR